MVAGPGRKGAALAHPALKAAALFAVCTVWERQCQKGEILMDTGILGKAGAFLPAPEHIREGGVCANDGA